MSGIALKLFALGIGVVWVLFLLARTFRSARRLDHRIATFREEQEKREREGRVEGPYAALAQLYAEEPKKPRRSRK